MLASPPVVEEVFQTTPGSLVNTLGGQFDGSQHSTIHLGSGPGQGFTWLRCWDVEVDETACGNHHKSPVRNNKQINDAC